MKQIITIKSQEELDRLKKVGIDEEVKIEAPVNLRLNSVIIVDGILKIYSKIDTNYYENRYVVARGQSHVVAWEQSHVVAWEQSHVEAWEQSHVVARGQSHVEAWEQSHVEAWEQTSVQVNSDMSIVLLFSFAVAIVLKTLKHQIKKKDKTAVIQEYIIEPFLEREGIKINKGKVILFKRVSKDYKTQEGTKNETLWQIGITVNHPNWQPEKDECGDGKYHAVSRPYFADEFRSGIDDKYIAIKIDAKDLYEWKNSPSYPHKIGFRIGKVLYECNKYGEELK